MRQVIVLAAFGIALLSALIMAGGEKIPQWALQNSEFFSPSAASEKKQDAKQPLLTLKQITITGLKNLSRETILKNADIKEGYKMAHINMEKIRAKLEHIDIIEKVTILRLLPDKIHIEITERTPFALWQIDKTFNVIDKNGVILSALNPLQYRHLPHIVGKNAPQHAYHLFRQLRKIWPQFAKTNPIAVRVNQRRWTLHTNAHMKIHLPEGNIDKELEKIRALDQNYNLLDREIEMIDMRMRDRIILKPTTISMPFPVDAEKLP